ncbi:hypothetical protein WOLCODRAFT_139335 [Wolfiporia cocos MD-104 SS10]|uniref:Uncharacterized protein n=1 Tax=Wolfiporia cocos (strain MD-104) TaxID=742152 RepID=A0A2H3K799_WOLCO|nr:hypothetical protein WOLCODRAFT_139335 [Wolfiporia cocos MD-104 SS10]
MSSASEPRVVSARSKGVQSSTPSSTLPVSSSSAGLRHPQAVAAWGPTLPGVSRGAAVLDADRHKGCRNDIRCEQGGRAGTDNVGLAGVPARVSHAGIRSPVSG